MSQQPSITDAVFDFGGVLLDWHPRLALEGAPGVAPDELDDLFSDDDRCGFNYFEDLRDGGMPADEVLSHYREEYDERTADLYQLFESRWALGLVGTIPGVEQLLDDLAHAGVRLWGLTNWAADRFVEVRRRFPELVGRLNGVIVSGEEGMVKPDPAIYALAKRRFGLEPRSTVFLDDATYNVQAAQEAGWSGIRFRCSEQARQELRALVPELR